MKCYFPKRKSNVSKPPSICTIGVESRYEWPRIIDFLSRDVCKKLMGLAIEIVIVFFFKNFTYEFGGETFLQLFGGPIGARLTMAVAQLVMEDWKEKFDEILKKSNIIELLSGLYVDDGRTFQRKLLPGERFDEKEMKFTIQEERRKK